MKRNILMFGCIIVCLILVSISYQPLIAEEKPLIKPKQEIQIIEEEDCGCSNFEHPIFCKFLQSTFIIRVSIYLFFGFWFMHIVLQMTLSTVENIWKNYNVKTNQIYDLFLEYCTDFPDGV